MKLLEASDSQEVNDEPDPIFVLDDVLNSGVRVADVELL